MARPRRGQRDRNSEEITVLLTQPTLSAPGVPLEPVFNPPSEGRWAGLGIAIRSAMVPFLQSLDPGYLPPSTRHKTVNSPVFTFGFADDSGFLQGVELAARLVSPCAGLPEGISNMMASAISTSAALRFAWDQWAAMSDSAPASELSDCPDKNDDKDKTRVVQADKRQQANKPAAAAMGAAQLPTVAFALGAMSCLATAEAQSIIEVADAETLGKIGRDPSYPLDGRYRQSSDIDGSGLSQSIGNRSHPFTGQYDGQCHTIDNLQRCLVQTLKDGGRVDSLRFTRANINSTETTGVVACEILDNAVASNIQVEDACVATSGDEKFAGIGAGYVRGAVTNMTVVNGMVTTSGTKAHAGISAGKLEGKDSAVTGSVSVNCKVSTFGDGSKSGIGAGHLQNGTVTGTLAVDSEVVAEGEDTATGIGAGHVNAGTLVGTTGVNSKVSTNGKDSYAAVGAGLVDHRGIVNETTGVCSQVIGITSYVGIGVGAVAVGTVNNTVAVRCLSLTSGIAAFAGIGAGFASVNKDWSERSFIDRTTSVNSTVSTSGSAGIGVGADSYGTSVSNTLAVYSKVLAPSADAGIAVGERYRGSVVYNTWAIECVIQDSGVETVYWGGDFERCNVLANGKNVSDTPRGCNCSLADLGKYAAPELVTEDCKLSNHAHMDIQQVLRNIRHSYPLQLDFFNPQQVRQLSVCWTKPVAPANKVTLAAGLSGGAVAGIALGAVAACAIVAGAAYVYYRYNRSDNSEGKEPVRLEDPELF